MSEEPDHDHYRVDAVTVAQERRRVIAVRWRLGKSSQARFGVAGKMPCVNRAWSLERCGSRNGAVDTTSRRSPLVNKPPLESPPWRWPR